MSASSKKKLRNEQNAEKMTERQLLEQKEAKKLKIYTSIFCVVLVALLIVGIGTFAYRSITTTGILQRNTVAATVGEHELNAVELNYYYVDAINSFCENYSYYLSFFIDTTLPLDEQMCDAENGITWADYFIDAAVSNAAYVYALADAAEAEGFTLTDAQLLNIDTNIYNAQFTAMYSYGFEDLDSYLVALYGTGSDEESYRAYLTMNTLASAYYDEYSANLGYTDEDIQAYNDEHAISFNSYSYNYLYLPMSNYLPEGITSDLATADEKAQAVADAEADAKALLEDDHITDVVSLDLAISLLKADENAASTDADDVMYDSVLSYAQEWITDPARRVGELTCVERTSTTTDDAGNETEEVIGYYVVMYTGSNDNTTALKNVRHCLIVPENGVYDESTGLYDYAEEDWAVALEEAEALLNEWKSGEATEASFADMANANSGDGDGTTGGLYTDVYPGQMVEAFEDWCFDPFRVNGDTGIVQTPYGYHIMYFVGNSSTSYRDYLITNELRSTDVDEWYNALLAAMPAEAKNTKYVNTSMVLNAG